MMEKCMLYRKIEEKIENCLRNDSIRMPIVDGARQVGKSFIIRHVGERMFPNYIEINMEEDKRGERLFIPSNMENKKKRIVAKSIEGKTGKRMEDYQDEFDYLISSGIALDVKAVSQPTFPLVQNMGKNLLKLYLNDVGIFSGILYRNNIKPVLDDSVSVNLGALYETVVAQELKAHGFSLYYYDNKQNGEVDYLIDDYENMTVSPIEVKSGRDYKIHSAINKFISNKSYNVVKAYVFSNERNVFEENGIIYLPIYYIMYFKAD